MKTMISFCIKYDKIFKYVGDAKYPSVRLYCQLSWCNHLASRITRVNHPRATVMLSLIFYCESHWGSQDEMRSVWRLKMS